MEPVIADLSQAGFQVERISDLRNKHLNYKRAIPILLHWLTKMENRDIKSELVSTLGTRFAKPTAAPILIEEFKRAPDDLHFKWAIADSLSFVADDSVYDEIVTPVRNKKHGKSREIFALTLANMHNPQAIDVLVDLLSDEDVAGHTIMALGRLKAEKAKPFIEPFLQHDKSWIRREAKRALAKIG